MPTILVTGASGFLGAHVVAAAARRGWNARAGVRDATGAWRLRALAPAAAMVACDLLSGPLDAAVDGVDAVVNCAAYGVDYRQSDFERALCVNVTGAVRLARAVAERGARLIHIGTSYEYGDGEGRFDEARLLAPSGIYGVTKAAATLALQDFARREGADVVVLRPFSMYGPLEGAHKFVPQLVAAAGNGQAIDLTPGEQQRDYLYVGDVAMACLDMVEARDVPRGAALNVCSGVGLSLRALAAAAMAAAGGEPEQLRWGAKPYRPAESMRVVGDPARLKESIGWVATTGLEEGMRLTVAAEALRPRDGESA